MKTIPTTAQRLKKLIPDFAILVGILLAAGLSNALLESYQAVLGPSPVDIDKAVTAVVLTVVFLVVLIRGSWTLHAKPGFWPGVGLLLLMHLAVVVVIWRMNWLRILWWIILTAETAFGIAVLRKKLRERH